MPEEPEEFQFEAIQDPDRFMDNVRYMLGTCPVARGYDRGGRFTVINRYEDVFRVLQDWRTFQTNADMRIPALPDGVPHIELPPMTENPPIQRHFRVILNPYFTPRAVAEHEDGIRAVARQLLDDFIASGSDDVVTMVTRPYSPRLAFRFLLGVDEAELERVIPFVHDCLYETHLKDTSGAEQAWTDWNTEILARRRAAPRRDDLIDGLLYGTVDGGRPLTQTELVGALNILMRGGFITTTDTASNFLIRLAEHKELQELLRDRPDLIPKALDEAIRLDPPVSGLPRQCTGGATFGDVELQAGERVFFNIAAANHDPSEFERPEEFDMDRPANRHFSFGGGVHRCIGLHFARLSLRVLFEEVFQRMDDIHLIEGREIRRSATESQFRVPEYIPLGYTAIPF